MAARRAGATLRLDHRDVALVQIEANDEVAGLAATSVCEEGMDIQVRPGHLSPWHAVLT
jgi:ERCC4-related helicase